MISPAKGAGLTSRDWRRKSRTISGNVSKNVLLIYRYLDVDVDVYVLLRPESAHENEHRGKWKRKELQPYSGIVDHPHLDELPLF